MRMIVVIALILAALCIPMSAIAAKGIVGYIKSGCSYYIVETPMGYALLEWYGGNTPSRGDTLVGDFESYGMKDIYNVTADSETRVWVDNYWMAKSRAIERYFEKCD